MKHLSLILLFILGLPIQGVKAETHSLEFVIAQALQNSPEIARILNQNAAVKAQAYEIETLENPSIELNVTALEKDASHIIGLEFEQPLRLSHFGGRGLYANALRQAANTEQKAQILELAHAVTRSYASYWALQEQEKLLSKNVKYARQKQKMIKQAAAEGRLDASDAKIFEAEALMLEEQLRVLRTKKMSGAVNLLKIAGMEQTEFQAQRPKSPVIPELADLMQIADQEGSIRSLLQSRKRLAERRYHVARQDAGLSEFTPRAAIERDLDADIMTALFGLNITIPIWDRNHAELSRAKAERNMAQSNLNAMNEQSFAKLLATTFEHAKSTQISASVYRHKIVPSWHDVQLITDQKFDNGQASILDLVQMRMRVADVQRDALQAYLNAIEARIILESLIGQNLLKIQE